jgi:hypothetical protein
MCHPQDVDFLIRTFADSPDTSLTHKNRPPVGGLSVEGPNFRGLLLFFMKIVDFVQ